MENIMPVDLKLSASDREFLVQVGDFVFGNPYSPARAELLPQLLPDTVASNLAVDQLALHREVERRLAPYDQNSAARLQNFRVEDQRLLAPAYLYLVYHRVVPAMDQLIDRQTTISGAAAEVTFADDGLRQLLERGFTEQEAVHNLALMYQLRRAYFFIERSLVGKSRSMRELRLAIWNSVFTHDMRNYSDSLWARMEDFSTVLLGETGTGKGSAAAAIGRSGFIPYLPEKRRFAANFTETFISINLSQYAETLIESELFGHRKGAFTGAIEHRDGLFARCSAHGSLFLDEIGEVSVPIQIKLLQVLQDRTFTPIGDRGLQRFAGRVIAATNRTLSELRQNNGLRADFFYRLCSDVIVLPPLRQRIEESPSELEELVSLLIARMTGAQNATLTDKILTALHRDLSPEYPWPGNVRELEQAVRRILLTGRYNGDLAPVAGGAEEDLVQHLRAGTIGAEEMLGRYCALLYERHGTYEDVARRTGLDRRTAKKYAQAGS
jgi:sigma-54 specific flagellar transcriptional regulator A